MSPSESSSVQYWPLRSCGKRDGGLRVSGENLGKTVVGEFAGVDWGQIEKLERETARGKGWGSGFGGLGLRCWFAGHKMKGCTETALGVVGLWDRFESIGLGADLWVYIWGCRVGGSKLGVQSEECRSMWGEQICRTDLGLQDSGGKSGVELGVKVLGCRKEGRLRTAGLR